MKKYHPARVVAVAAALAGLAWPSAQAFAQAAAYTSAPVYVYAGPSGDYPVVSSVDGGVPVTVMGCVSDYSWCDVAFPGLRGWVYAAYLSYPYEGQYVPLQGYGSVIGLPIIGFSLGAYWGNFYRGQPWYGERERWAHVPPPGYGGRPSEPRPGAHPHEQGRPFAAPPNAGHPGEPPVGARPAPQPGGNYGEPHRMQPEGGPRPMPPQAAPRPMQPEGAPRPMQPEGVPHQQGPQGGFQPGAPAGGFERGAPQMHAPGGMPAQGRPAAPPQGGRPSGGEGGGSREGRLPGQ
jgi:uncharacterized protein YraI